MKKMLIILCALLISSCSQFGKSVEINDSLAQSVDFNNSVAMYNGERGFYAIESGLFFIDNSDLKFYNFDTTEVLELSSLSFCDDKSIKKNESCDVKNYSESIQTFSIIQVYNNQIYYPTERYDIKNGFSYVLNKVDLIGENKETVYTFENYIHNFIIHRGKLVYLRSDKSSITIVDLDSEQKDLYFEYPLGGISRVTAHGDFIYFVAIDNSNADKNENVYSYNINTQELNLDMSISNIDFPLITDNFISEMEFYPISNSDEGIPKYTHYNSFLIDRETNVRLDLGLNRELIHMDNSYYYFTNKIYAYLNPEINLEFTITDHDFNVLKEIEIPNATNYDYLTVVNDKYVVLSKFIFLPDGQYVEYYICDYWSDNPEFIKITE